MIFFFFQSFNLLKNIKLYNFILIITLTILEIISSESSERKFQKEVTCVESTLNKNGQLIQRKNINNIYISEINNLNITLDNLFYENKFKNYNISIPISENILNKNSYFFNLELKLERIRINENKILNQRIFNKQNNKIEIKILLNKKKCLHSYFNENQKNLSLKCIYQKPIKKICKIHIIINNNKYNFNCFNNISKFINPQYINIIDYTPKYINIFNNHMIQNNITIEIADELLINNLQNIKCLIKNNINDLYLISQDIFSNSNKIYCSLDLNIIKEILLKNPYDIKAKEIEINLINEKIIKTNKIISIKILENKNISYKRNLLSDDDYSSFIYNLSIDTECPSGTFLNSEILGDNCLDCPDGYDCYKEGTYWPIICKEGYYKTNFENCIPCPKGTFSLIKGIKDSSLCTICPPGTYCDIEGINKLEDINICKEGYVCGEGTEIYDKEKCPQGFSCSKGTKPFEKYKSKCKEGFICSEGTGELISIGCPEDYYCPKGTMLYEYMENELLINDYSLIPKCPFGTSSYHENYLSDLIDCIIKRDFHIFMNFDIVEFYQNEFEEVNEFTYYKYFKNLDIVDISLSKYDSSLNFGFQLNTMRKSLISFSPINLTSSYKPYKTEELDINEFTTFFKICKHYFKIEKNSYALITIDLRHIISPLNDFFFIYGIDWDISFEKVISIENNNFQILDMPTTFISKQNDKSNAHEFNIYTFEDMILSININIYNGLYFTYISYFKDIATLLTLYPERAELNTNKFFGIFLFKENVDTIYLPVNIPIKNTTYNSATNLEIKDKILKNIISYNSLTSKNMIKNEIREGYNYFLKMSNYWEISNSIGMTHIPFISNCKGYGKYIHLWSLLEQNSQCELKPENETVFIKDFSFRLNAIGDKCNISLQCIFDEDVGTISNNKFWYETANSFSLFKITKNPISLEKMNDPENLELVDVKVQNSLENDEIPRIITLIINYYQVSTTLKRIIDAEIIFSDPWNKSQIQKLNDTVNYTFNVILNPYSHTDLMITFALSSNFYIVLYLFEGFVSTIIVFIFFFIHRRLSKINPRPTFKFRSFFPIILPPVLIGILLSIIPIFLEIIICHFIFVGKFIFKKFKIFNMTNSRGEECNSIFDLIGYIGEAELEDIRKGRLGTAFFILGILLSYYHTQLVVPNVPIKSKRSFDNNRFDFVNWKRIYVFYVDFILSILNIYYTILSFCGLWSRHIWAFIYSYKIIGIIAENYFEEMFKEQLLIAGFGCLFNLMQNMLTFGASNLLEFLLSSLIEQTSLIVEKVYIEGATNWLKDHWDEIRKKIKDFRRKLLNYDVDIEFEIKENGNVDEEDDDEAIILEEEKEMKNTENENSSLDKQNNLDNDSNNKENVSDIQSNGKKNIKKEIEIEEYLDRYKGFASDLLSYFYNIFFYFLLWITREENYILDYYDISDENFIYFYYFSMVNIFFSIINDIILHNLLENFADIQMHDFLDYFNYIYHIRTENWALDQKENNLDLDPSSIKMFKIGFSSQYYYLTTFYASGLLLIVIGLVTLILNGINPFLDIATPLIILFIYITLKLNLTFFSLFIHLFKIWEIDKENNISNINNNLNENDNKNKIEKHPFEGEKWDKIKFIKEQEQLIEENLKTERLILDITKKQFIAQNKKWLKDEINSIITPRTLLQNKLKLIEVLGKKYSKEIKTNYNILPVKLYSPNNSYNKENDDEDEINSSDYSFKNRKKIFKKKSKKNKIVIDILRIWKNRIKLNKKLKKIIRLAILDLKKNKCCICGNENNLNVAYEGNLINTFFKYLKESHQTMNNFKELDFKIYFKKAEEFKIKTKCINCS